MVGAYVKDMLRRKAKPPEHGKQHDGAEITLCFILQPGQPQPEGSQESLDQSFHSTNNSKATDQFPIPERIAGSPNAGGPRTQMVGNPAGPAGTRKPN